MGRLRAARLHGVLTVSDLLIVIEGVREAAEALGYARKLIDANTSRALNKTATRTRTRLSRVVRDQVAFPASYLGPSSGRLSVAERATPNKLAIRIDGRDRPTSLARFASGPPRAPKVRVKPGGIATRIPRSFIINLRNGNKGLAVRTDGGKPDGAWKPKEMAPGLWLLYGPSVDQVLMGVGARDGGAFGDTEEWAIDFFEQEFLRLMKVEFD